jgi:hypothetical protein
MRRFCSIADRSSASTFGAAHGTPGILNHFCPRIRCRWCSLDAYQSPVRKKLKNAKRPRVVPLLVLSYVLSDLGENVNNLRFAIEGSQKFLIELFTYRVPRHKYKSANRLTNVYSRSNSLSLPLHRLLIRLPPVQGGDVTKVRISNHVGRFMTFAGDPWESHLP